MLQVVDGEVKPIDGVRPYADLKVGERVFTLGAPAGLEHSLAEGIVSGKREAEGAAYVQTTAPISPGSSGGGLFDEMGNLVGITTFVYEGREHRNQSLNFAIAGDRFWTSVAKPPAAAADAGDDPDVQLSVDGVHARISTRVDDDPGQLKVVLRHGYRDVPTWTHCKVRLTARKAAFAELVEASHRLDERAQEEHLQFAVPYAEMLAWSQMRHPMVRVCRDNVLLLAGEDLVAVRRALRLYRERHPGLE